MFDATATRRLPARRQADDAVASRFDRRDLIAVCAVGVIAFVPRIALALIPAPFTLVFDMQDYWQRALYMAEHARLYENSYRMPGYPAALALVFALGSGASLS